MRTEIEVPPKSETKIQRKNCSSSRKGLLPVNCRRQALQFCLDPAVVVVIQICNEFLLEVFHGLKFLQVQQFALEQPKEIFYHSIVQTVPFPAHALLDAFLSEHALVLLVLILPALVRMENEVCSEVLY